jgi:Fe2+ transport system protein FeoA
MLRLNSAKFGKLYEIDKIDPNAPMKIRRRLYDLGFTSGQKVTAVRKSLLGKAYLVEIRAYTLSLRSTVAEAIILKESGGAK